MSSPFIPYQTKDDLNRESQFISFLSKKWKFDYKKLGDFSVFDFECSRDGKTVAFVEVKNYFGSVSKYPTYICTVQDVDHGLKLTEETGLPAFLVVKWPECVGYLRLTHNNYFKRKSGQKNRNDPRDYDTMVYLIPLEEFKMIEGFEYD